MSLCFMNSTVSQWPVRKMFFLAFGRGRLNRQLSLVCVHLHSQFFTPSFSLLPGLRGVLFGRLFNGVADILGV
jgi:hypothetical protein